MIEFYAFIDRNYYRDFSGYSQLIEHIRNNLLPICNLSRGYKFYIGFGSDKNSAKNVIESLLQMPAIKQCSHVEFKNFNGEKNQLPVDAISNWLERSADGIENKFQNTKEKFLEVKSFGINNAQEMLEHLKTVFLIILYIISVCLNLAFRF